MYRPGNLAAQFLISQQDVLWYALQTLTGDVPRYCHPIFSSDIWLYGPNAGEESLLHPQCRRRSAVPVGFLRCHCTTGLNRMPGSLSLRENTAVLEIPFEGVDSGVETSWTTSCHTQVDQVSTRISEKNEAPFACLRPCTVVSRRPHCQADSAKQCLRQSTVLLFGQYAKTRQADGSKLTHRHHQRSTYHETRQHFISGRYKKQ